MATPMTSSQFLAQCTKHSVRLDTTRHPGWATHNRNTIAADGPSYGVAIHHTGSTAQLGMVHSRH